MRKDALEKFQTLVKDDSDLNLFIDNIEQKDENTITYLYDGYIPCAILYRDGKYWDIQDSNPPYDDYKQYTSYDNIESIFGRLLKENAEDLDIAGITNY